MQRTPGNSSNSVANTIENIKFKIVRNSHLLLHNIGIFSSAMAIVTQTSINCSYAKTSKQQLMAHTSIVRVNHNKVLQTHMPLFLQIHTLIFQWCYTSNWDHSTNEDQIYYLHNKITLKTQQNGSFFSYKK